MNQKKLGILLSYMNTAATALMNIFLVPFLISTLGASEYGVYKVINSFAGYLIVLDLGIGTLMTRYVSLYSAKKDKEKTDKSVATCAVVCLLMIFAVVIIGIIIRTQINTLYGNTFTKEELELAHRLFNLMLVNICITLATNLFTGYINAFERFALTNGFSVLRIVARFGLLYFFVTVTKNSITVITVDVLINLALLLFFAVYCFVKLKMRIIPRAFDKRLLGQYALFSGAILFQTIVNQVNNSVDNVILGAMTSPKTVTMYSSGLTIYGMYVALPDAVNHVFLPQATRLFGEKLPDDDGVSITKFVSRAGRYEAMICLAIIGGLFSCGKDFITLWIGNENIGAFGVALTLIVPITIPLCENLMVTVLNATNKRMFRSVVLATMAVFNVAVSVILVPYIGYYGAAIGTFLSITIGHGIILNIYYKKKFRLRIGELFKNTYLRTVPCCAVATAVSLLFSLLFVKISWINFIIKCLFFLLIYAIALYAIGISREERKTINKRIKNILCRK